MIDLVKFIHLLCALSVLGGTLFCCAASLTQQSINFKRFNLHLLFLALIAMATGSILVYPKHFTFHTAWIQAAYILVTLFCGVMIGLMVFAKKMQKVAVLRFIYLALLVLLVLVVHDAVTKTTLLF